MLIYRRFEELMLREKLRMQNLSKEERDIQFSPSSDPKSSFNKLFGHFNNPQPISPPQLNRTTYADNLHPK